MTTTTSTDSELNVLYHLAFADLTNWKIVAPGTKLVNDFINDLRDTVLAGMKNLTEAEKASLISKFEKRNIPITDFIRYFCPGFEFTLIKKLIKDNAELAGKLMEK